MKKVFNQPFVYAVKHSDKERMMSQSGGMFAALSDGLLDHGGVVYGCIFNEKFEAVHTRAESKTERDAMRKSKYVQSNMLSVMIDILQDLKDGREVLFSGTSCQVSGVRNFVIAKDLRLEKNLYCVDIICHGVPSPMVWKDYLNWESKRMESEIKNVVCRNKEKYGWHSHVTTIVFMNGKEVDSCIFPRIFYSHNALRPSCYKCPYKDVTHPGDITIADYWGIEKALPNFKDDMGVSLVLVNNQKGVNFFESCCAELIFEQTLIKDSMQQPLIAPYDPPKTREQFWRCYKEREFLYVAKKYGSYGVIFTVKRKIKNVLKRVHSKLSCPHIWQYHK